MTSLSTMWTVTFAGIVLILALLVASTAFRCLSSNAVASVLQIGAIVIFVVLFAFMLVFFLGNAHDSHRNLDEFNKKPRAKYDWLRMPFASNSSNSSEVDVGYFPT